MPADKLTEQQIETLDGYLESFREASKKERRRVLQNALIALFPKSRDSSKEDKTQRQESIEKLKPVTGWLNSCQV
jgi:hypothetical protein